MSLITAACGLLVMDGFGLVTTVSSGYVPLGFIKVQRNESPKAYMAWLFVFASAVLAGIALLIYAT